SGHVCSGERERTGYPLRDLYRLGVGRTFQITETFTSMTVRENVQVALLSHHRALHNLCGFAPSAYWADAERILGFAGIADKAGRAGAELAYGDLKRLELAIALAGEPRLLLVDAPPAGMPPAGRTGPMPLGVALARAPAMVV